MKEKFLIPQFRPFINNVSIIQAIKKICESGILVNGEYTRKLTKILEKKFQGKKILLTDSGTSALILTLLALKCEGKAVLIPTFSCSALLSALLQVGAKPVLYDIEYPYFYHDLQKIKKNAQKDIGAVIVVHPLGRATNVEDFVKVFEPQRVIEDCATSFGTYRKDRLCGTFSCASVLSFGPTKYISSSKGGAILVEDSKQLQYIVDIYYYDKKNTLQKRYNFLSNEISNAISYFQIRNFKSIYNRRKQLYTYYKLKLNNICKYPNDNEKENNFFKFIILTKKKEKVKEIFNKNKIEVSEPVFLPLHRLLKEDKRKFPGSEQFFSQCLSLPLYPAMKKKQIDKIANLIQANSEAFDS
jgi:dTDP-4-amino-4,6-dideoxygalactose transaminase